ncbi:sensor histidine kinase KdpD [Streptacidiphilus sp. P02-A3a]|uniref:sensor histidine kinase n=1 Tax=Streptacidiphilus sp. P02-A3a TaxID=2704468 RepID=UPI0015F90B77|nr:ATP-binding protein [Streptacidiphilus sp. P02-A3a]QMU70953.1 sensor histidine kinase [Streptacidiphilus sp. P02-A3a]
MYISIAIAATALAVVLVVGVQLARSRRAARQHQQRHRQVETEFSQLQHAHQQLQGHAVQLAAERDELAAAAKEREAENGEVLANLALRTLGLVERQLSLLEGMEGSESDSLRLEQLYRLDHLATRMRRNGENLLLLGGAVHHRPAQPQAPTPLLDVLRAALSEIERYERVHLTPLPRLWIRSDVAEDLAHLFAELLENGTAFSPPTEPVTVTGWQLQSGELMVTLVDRGIGLPDELLYEVNTRLAAPADLPASGAARTGRSMGLQVVTILARRHGLRVQLRHSTTADGTTALVAVPVTAFAAEPAPAQPAAAAWDEMAADAAAQQTRPLSAVPGPRPAAVTGTGAGADGLPKRVPGESGQRARRAGAAEEDGQAASGPSAAEELRRRLGGFQSGVRAAAPQRAEEEWR